MIICLKLTLYFPSMKYFFNSFHWLLFQVGSFYNIKFFALTVPVLSLAACAVPEAYDGGGRGYMPPVQNQAGPADFRAFSCENGLSVRVRRLDGGKIALRLDGRRAVLSSDVAASGERYTAEHGLFGNGTEWHQKGGEAFFGFTDAYGNSVETSCRAR